MGQEKSNSRLPLLVAFLLGACITFLLFRLGDVYGFAIPLDTGGSSSDGRPASPVPVLVPAPPGYRPPTATDEPVLVPAPPSPPRLPTPVNTSIAPVPTTTPPPIRQISALRLKKDIWPSKLFPVGNTSTFQNITTCPCKYSFPDMKCRFPPNINTNSWGVLFSSLRTRNP